MRIQRQLSNGTMWADTDEYTDKYIAKALDREPMQAPWFKREPLTDKAQVLDHLASGETLKYDDEWYEMLRDADAAKWQPKPRRVVEMVRCDCGHDVPAGTAMSSSRGSCCPDCYDRMSDFDDYDDDYDY